MVRGERGLLYVVATPIGNLADLTDRARQTLGAVDLIAAEDTRETRRLLAHFGITKRLIAYHDHNESAATPHLIESLLQGQDLALVSDAGTPTLSDPGYRLVAAAWEAGIRVVPIPGASAAICALSAAGLPTDRFLFLGFPPRGSTQRRTWIAAVAGEPGTLILYESAKRATETLRDLSSVLGDARAVVVARELTKRFETLLRGSPGALAERLATDPEQRLGELVILVSGASGAPAGDRDEQERVLRILAEDLPLTQAAALAARITGAKRNALYRLGLTLGIGRGAESAAAHPPP
ncbi:MAG: 16S rRNA (cytidine(1402)-2'-O)-methyltransferase [Bdellovibrio bacteriovorus]